jgi:hypothetical protein
MTILIEKPNEANRFLNFEIRSGERMIAKPSSLKNKVFAMRQIKKSVETKNKK